MHWLHSTTTALSLAALVFHARSADACSAPPCTPLFATPGSGGDADTVPVNARGVRIDAGGEELAVTLSRVVGDSTEIVETTATSLGDGTTLLEPTAAFQVGEKYVVSGADCHSGQDPDPVPTFGTFTVTETAELPTALGTTVAAAPVRGPLRVIGGPACSEEFDAHAAKVTLTLDESAKPWKSALVYELFVDGEAYRDFTVAYLAGENPYLAEATVYQLCVDGADGLAAGKHQVAFHATLPGSDVALVATSAEVELDCGDDDVGGPGGSAGAGGSSSGGGKATGGSATGGTTTDDEPDTTSGGGQGSDSSGCSFGGVPAAGSFASAFGSSLAALLLGVAVRRRKRH